MGKKKPARPRPGTPSSTDDARTVPPHPNHVKMRISFECYEAGQTHCLCRLNEEQIKSFLECLRKLTERTWQQLIDGSSRDPRAKTGLNSTVYERSDLINRDIWPVRFSQDITQILGVRASERRRVFGVRIDGAFYVIWFDEDHGVVRS
jgi:hypothetical protein